MSKRSIRKLSDSKRQYLLALITGSDSDVSDSVNDNTNSLRLMIRQVIFQLYNAVKAIHIH